MKRATSSCSLAIVIACLVLLEPRSSFAQSEAALPTLQIGDSLERIRLRTQFLLDAEEGQTVRLRWDGTHLAANCEVPLEALIDVVTVVTNADGVMSLDGPPPYPYYLQGEGHYSLLLEIGSAIEGHEVGRLAPDEVLQVTIPPADDRLDYLTLDVNPEATITLNWSVTQTEFRIRDGAGNPVYPRNDHWNDRYAIADLSQGTPPFVVSLDDARYAGQTFTFTLAEGEMPLSRNPRTES